MSTKTQIDNSPHALRTAHGLPSAPELPPWLARIGRRVLGPLTWRNTLAWVVIIAAFLTVRWLFFDVYYIPSGSMEPTLHGHPFFPMRDFVLVNKAAYAARIPFTTQRVRTWDRPERWDIVVFRSVDPGTAGETIIKRVAGLPGETVQIEDGELYVDGGPPERPADLQEIVYTQTLEPTEAETARYVTLTAPENEEIAARDFVWTYRGLEPFRYGVLEEPPFAETPAAHYFMLGDNSPQSVDSRHYGWVPENHILGEAVAVVWPPARWRDLSGFTNQWWGLALLYGLPALVIAVLIVQRIVAKRV